jgi:superfamily II RNA helicase
MDETTTKTPENEVKISLAKLMKVKNRLAGRIAATQAEIVAYNSTVQGSEAPDVKKLYEQYEAQTAQMIKLKVALYDANRGGQQERIFLLAEKKSKLTWLRSMNTRNGPQTSYDDKVINYVATFKKADVDALVRQLEREIDETQDAIDSFNASRKVVVDSELFTLVG